MEIVTHRQAEEINDLYRRLGLEPSAKALDDPWPHLRAILTLLAGRESEERPSAVTTDPRPPRGGTRWQPSASRIR